MASLGRESAAHRDIGSTRRLARKEKESMDTWSHFLSTRLYKGKVTY